MDKKDKRLRLILLAIVWILFLIVAFTWPPGRAEDEEEYYTLYVLCKPKSHVNVREFPRRNGKVTGRLECGDAVITAGKRRGQYLKICGPAFESAECWVHAGYLTEDEPTVWKDGKKFTVAGKGRVALRRYIRGQRRAWTRPGKVLTVYAMTEEWSLTNRGYIRTEYLEETPEIKDTKGVWK